MTTSYQLGISSADAVTMQPDFGYEQSVRLLQRERRSESGKLFTVILGSYDSFKFPTNFVPSSATTLVNSWYETKAPLLFFINSGPATEVHSVQIIGNKTPLARNQKPYNDQFKGIIVLETY